MKVEIIDTAYGGYGVAKEGKIIFVAHSVEGDVVDISIKKENKNFCYANINSIIQPSKHRIKSKCKYAGICGGCVFNHIEYNKQLEIKKNIVLNSIRNIEYKNKINIIKSPNEHYRLRVNMIAQNGNIGFYKFNTNEFVNIDECIILKEKLFCKIKNFVNRSNITGNIYAIESNNDKTLSFADIIKQNKNIDTSYFDGITIKQKKKIKIYGIDKTNYNTYFGVVPLSHKSFFQSNHYLLDEFQKSAVKYFNEYDKNIVELYAGSGFFSVAIKNKLESLNIDYKLISSEISSDAVNIAKDIIKEDARETLKKINYNVDSLFVDPPREGLDKKVIENIIRIKPKKIIYISCNPMTFSRDINLLKEYYQLIDLNIIDMFPDTYHIELISCLEIK
ncbi:class I SAM-dependent RNA methyltransferase [Brachyspira pilosicoli]|uniref:class I SAM-dependent RNA methyltransferase n=1 Tax=Brachyspira pilosicoli TaxID=52584 RepID=UPI0025431BB6|nr:class I SAM-dependent RNA methyltransferase [Brachyspira pilosicoli]WIH81563.1 class I SAM-dependent RNA methyltransferase [Brachyspira pilosicoli]WIH85999.1 class I SAM-dependent RNA methyltransferase [Brachyspira pilosicoli]